MSIKTTQINKNKLDWLLAQPIDTKLELLKNHLEIIRIVVNQILTDEVTQLCGDHYSHNKPNDSRYSRWGYNPGSVKIDDQKLKLSVPRVYDNKNESNKSLENYEQLRQLNAIDDNLSKKILFGLSTHDYGKVVDSLVDSFGLSSSSVSQEFKRQTENKLREFESRRLEDYDFVALFIDGKYLAKEQMVIVLGVTSDGNKVPLGFIQTKTENAESISSLFSELIERGLHYKNGLLFIIDGAKGLKKAIEDTFGDYAIIQRCQWHKRENIVSYLNEKDQQHYRIKLNRAYNADSYDEAKQKLLDIKTELEIKNLTAARSLEEGMEETLTLHRLVLHDQFSTSFSTTNCIENLNSQLTKYIGKVKYWKNSSQRFRWVAAALLEIEKRMRKVNNYKNLHIMKKAIKKEINKKI